MFNFSEPYFLIGVFLPPVILIISYLRNFISPNRYCDKKLLTWVIEKNKNSLSNTIFHGKIVASIAWILFCIALSGPRLSIDERSSVDQKTYNNATVIVLDLSRSMLVEDIYPNRISKAKLLIDAILATTTQRLFSLVVYANNAHTVIPLTYDSSVIRQVIKSIRPNMLPVEGSNYKAGLKQAITLLNQSGIKNKSIILFSDGDFSQKKILSKLPIAKNIQINVFGIGTPQGQAIPLKKGGWLTYKNRAVISRLNKTNLKEIAAYYKGKYQTANIDLDTTNIKLTAFPVKHSSIQTSSHTVIIWKQLYSWFLIPAIFFYLLGTITISSTSLRFRTRIKANKINHIATYLMVGLLFIFSIIPFSSEAKESPLDLANKAYLKKNYIKAESLFKKSTGFDAIFGQANSLYKQKNYLKAIHYYIKAVLATNNQNKRAWALYNLANSYYLIGDYPQAIRLYKDTLKYKPNFHKAETNLKYAITLDKKVKKALALLRKMRKASSTQAGSGSRTSDVEQGIDVGNSKVTLGDHTDKLTLYFLPLDEKLTNLLIQRGIKYSRISSTKIDKPSLNKDWNFDHTTFDMVELLVNQEKIDNFNLWKRLFEIEEGFPAPVENPHTKPGVSSW